MTTRLQIRSLALVAAAVHEQMNFGNHEFMNPPGHEFMKKVVNA